jgi:hypothetical protein
MFASRLLRIVAAAILLVLLAGVAVLIWRDIKTKRTPNHALFRQGTIPQPLPDGDYEGHVTGYSGDWIGKTFDARHSTGKNRFKSGQGVELRYPFKTVVGPGLADPNAVVKIDYDIPGNPLWLRRILDEIVQVGPNHYLGKIHLRLGPIHVAVGYFELKK